MNEAVYYFAAKSIGLSFVNGRKPCTLLGAARHNLREIQAEMGAASHIDPTRTGSNLILAGPDTAAAVQALAASLLEIVDTSKLKRDHCQAIEVVFSLPAGARIELEGYLYACLAWLRVALPLPVLQAVIHLDESTPHLHVLLLPVVDGRHVGGAPIALSELKRLREEFFSNVAGPAGLRREGAKVRGTAKQWAVAAVLQHCEATGLPAAIGPLWPFMEAAIKRDPTDAMRALEIDLNDIRPTNDAQPNYADTSPLGLHTSPKGLQNEVQKHQALSCVGLVHETPSKPSLSAPSPLAENAREPTAPPATTDTRTAARCSPKSKTESHADRIATGRQAMQEATARGHAGCVGEPVTDVQEDSGGNAWVREREEEPPWADW